MLIFEIPWSKLCDKNSNCTFLWIFSLLWRHVCVEPSLFTQTFQKPKKYFVKNLLSHFEKKTKTTRLLSSPLSLQLSSNKHLQVTTAQCPKSGKIGQYYWKLIVINIPMYLPLSWLITPWAKKFFTTSTGGGLFWWKLFNQLVLHLFRDFTAIVICDKRIYTCLGAQL